MRKALVGLTIVGTLLLAGCSSNVAAEGMFTPPGIELGSTIVDPPAPLPDALPVEEETEGPTTELAECAPIEDILPVAIEEINHPNSSDGSKASVSGELVVSARQMPITSLYQKNFNILIEAKLDSGKTIWFGSRTDINKYEGYQQLVLEPGRNEPIFGANAAAYESFIWGGGGPTSSIVAESSERVEAYAHCFSAAS